MRVREASARTKLVEKIEKICARFDPVPREVNDTNGEVKEGDVYSLVHGNFLVTGFGKQTSAGGERQVRGVYIDGEFGGYGVNQRVVIPEHALIGQNHHHLTTKDYQHPMSSRRDR
jgi:hypothetical protein